MTEREQEHRIPKFMRIVAKRGKLLQRLDKEPAHKRDLVAELDHSRSTVDRAIRELVDEQLVTKEDGRYRTTAAGAVACRAHFDFVDLAYDIDAARDLLAHLPASEPPGPMLLKGADVARATDLTRIELFEPIQSRLREADAITAILPELADISHLDIYRQQAEAGVPIRLVLAPELYETLQTQRPRTLCQLERADSVISHVAETQACGLLLTEYDGSSTVTVLLFQDGQVIGTIVNDARDVVAWVQEIFAELCESEE